MGKRVVIAIAGGSGSGKTLLSERLREELKDVAVLPLDAFYRDQSGLTREERAKVNYDDPGTIDFAEYHAALRALREGAEEIEIPSYDFADHVRRAPRRLKGAPIIITEGTLVLIQGPHRKEMDYAVFVKTSGDIRLLRRIRRDVAERGRSVSSVLDQYLATVRPMHRKWISPSEREADFLFRNDGMDGLDEGEVEKLLEEIRRKIS